MIRQLHTRSFSSRKQKQMKSTFIPFENQRDNLGRIIRPKTQKKNGCNIMKMFENLKKSTKEHFFQKEFHKMAKKFQYIKQSLDNKEQDYDREVDKCIEIVRQLMERRNQGSKNKDNLYVTLREKIDSKINGASLGLKTKRINSPLQKSLQKSQNVLKGIQSDHKRINIKLFKNLSARSEMMATFCANGLKYQGLVEQKKLNPWKTWYKKERFQLFPGKKVQVRCLQKSIYE